MSYSLGISETKTIPDLWFIKISASLSLIEQNKDLFWSSCNSFDVLKTQLKCGIEQEKGGAMCGYKIQPNQKVQIIIFTKTQ